MPHFFPTDEIIYDDPGDCPYLPERICRLPLRMVRAPISPAQWDQRLEIGMRRCGVFLYVPTCPQCSACEALRIDVEKFQPNRSQRRVKRRNDQAIQISIQTPLVDETRVRLFNEHRRVQNLLGVADADDINASGYHHFLVESCCATLEFAFHRADALAAVSILDVGADSASAVYCFYGADFRRWSLGVYSVLAQIEYCRQQGIRYLYLGFYIAGSAHMVYKANYLPHERLIDGRWVLFDA